MEMIFIVLLFLGPGLAIKTLDNYIYQRRVDDQNLYSYLFNIVVHGLVVFVPTVLILNLVLGVQIKTFTQIVESMDSTKTALLYGLAATVVCLAWWYIYDKFLRKLILKLKNKSLPQKLGIVHEEYEDVYTEIFHNPENRGRRLPVSIYKDGLHVVSGNLVGWNSPNSSPMEFRLDYTQEIETILKEDMAKGPHEVKLLDYVRFEYYVPETNLLIKFYNREMLEEHWRELYSGC